MTNSDNKSIRSYTQEDIQQILHLAIARQADDQNKEFSYEQLLEIADELQIPPDSLKLAERDWLTQQGEAQRRLAFDAHRQKQFKKRLGNYAMINSFFLLIDFIGGWTISWSLYPLSIFILAAGIEGWNTFSHKGEEYEAAFQRWNRKHQLKKSFSNLINRFLKAVS
jgi:2TM domain